MGITLLWNNNIDGVILCVIHLTYKVFMRYCNIIYVFFFASPKGDISFYICCKYTFHVIQLFHSSHLMLKFAIYYLIKRLHITTIGTMNCFRYNSTHKSQVMRIKYKKENKCKRRVHQIHARLRLNFTHLFIYRFRIK